MKEITTKISATTLILIYLFSCGTIYLVAYWSTFNFDITNYIDFLDIPKSFVFPLATGIGISFISFLIQGVARSFDKIEKDEKINAELLPKIKELPTKTLLFRIINDFDFWTILVLFICLIFYKPQREWVYAILSITLIISGVVKFIRHPKIITFLPNFGLRLFFAILIFFIPIFSFTTGKLNAIKILNNQEYFKVSNITYSEPSVSNQNIVNSKLLGKLGTNLFVSDSVNSEIIILNLETVKSIEYKLVKTKLANK